MNGFPHIPVLPRNCTEPQKPSPPPQMLPSHREQSCDRLLCTAPSASPSSPAECILSFHPLVPHKKFRLRHLQGCRANGAPPNGSWPGGHGRPKPSTLSVHSASPRANQSVRKARPGPGRSGRQSEHWGREPRMACTHQNTRLLVPSSCVQFSVTHFVLS